METVNIHDAKTHFSRLIERVKAGEEIDIAKAGKPVARLTPMEPKPRNKISRLGFMRGAFTVPDDFNDMGCDEIEALFLSSD